MNNAAYESGMVRPYCDEIVLIGAGRNAHNLICVFEESDLTIGAVLDDRQNENILGYPVMPITEEFAAGRAAIMSITDPHLRQSIVERQSLRSVEWTTFVDPRAMVSKRAVIGKGSFIAPFTVLVDVKVGMHASIKAGAVLGARVVVGDYTIILLEASLASDCCIGSGVIIGMGARIHAGVKIGDGCRIAPNTVVRHDMPDHTLAFPTSRTLTRPIRVSAANSAKS